MYDPLRDERSYFPRPGPYPNPSIPNPFAPDVNPNGPFCKFFETLASIMNTLRMTKIYNKAWQNIFFQLVDPARVQRLCPLAHCDFQTHVDRPIWARQVGHNSTVIAMISFNFTPMLEINIPVSLS